MATSEYILLTSFLTRAFLIGLQLIWLRFTGHSKRALNGMSAYGRPCRPTTGPLSPGPPVGTGRLRRSLPGGAYLSGYTSSYQSAPHPTSTGRHRAVPPRSQTDCPPGASTYRTCPGFWCRGDDPVSTDELCARWHAAPASSQRHAAPTLSDSPVRQAGV